MASGSYNVANQETTGSSAYDAAGNMTTFASGGTATYDAWNRLATVTDGYSPLAKYSYDGLNRRTRKTTFSQNSSSENGGDRYYYNLAGQMVEDCRVSSSNVPDYVEQYVWSLRYIDSPVVCLHDGTLDGDVDDDYAEHGAADWRTYYLTDANHNVTTTIRVDNNNSVVQKGGVDVGIVHYAYTPFGSMTLYNALWASESGCIEDSFDRPLYAGYFFDVETGLYQVRARYYDPSLSRFINRDPIGYNGGMNLYAYCGGNPINATDPMGTDSRLEQLQKDLAEELKQHGNTQWAKTLQWAIDEAQGKDPHDAEMRRNYEDLERARSYSLTHWIMEGLSALESVEHELANQQLIRNVSMGLRQLRYEISVVR